MLEAVQIPRAHVGHTMPMDFASYLLSSSPPASNFELLSVAFNSENSGWNQRSGYVRRPNNIVRSGSIIKNTSANVTSDGDSDGESLPSSGTQTPVRSQSPARSGKKVSFADHKGLALATVRIMTEPSDMPPRLGPDIISSLTKDTNASVTGLPPFELKFTQPASDYLAFREAIEKNCVSLENVILKDYSVMGTIKVKNVSFEKKVYLRSTFNGWASSKDIDATYVPRSGEANGQSIDTFSFEFDLETNFDFDSKVEFAVCFETPAGQYWDNNNGKNYKIEPTNFNRLPKETFVVQQTNVKVQRVPSWTEYACWNHVDTNTPYY